MATPQGRQDLESRAWHVLDQVVDPEILFRDYIYVSDVVEAYLVLAQKAPCDGIRGEAFNFSPERPLTVLEITHKILELMGRSDLEPLVLDEAKGEIRNQYLDSSKANRLLKWTPQYSLEKGLIETIEWYKDFFSSRS